MIVQVDLSKNWSDKRLIPSCYNKPIENIDYTSLVNMCFQEMVQNLNIPAEEYMNKFLKINILFGDKNFGGYDIKDHKVTYYVTYTNKGIFGIKANPWNRLYVVLHEIGHVFQFTLVGMVYAKYFKNTDYNFREPRITYEEEAADIFASYFLLKYCKKLFKETNPSARTVKEFIATFVYPGNLTKDINKDLSNFITNERHYSNLLNKVNFIYKVLKADKIYEIYKPYLKAIRTKSNWVIHNEI